MSSLWIPHAHMIDFSPHVYDTVLPFALGIGLDTLQVLFLIADHTGGVRLGMRGAQKRHQQQADSSHLSAVLLAFVQCVGVQ